MGTALVMPVLRPLPIKTKGQAPLKRVWAWLKSRRQWELLEDWSYVLADGTVVTIKAGFIFDGASVPRIFWWFLSPVDILLIPALMHDYGYEYGYLPSDKGLYGRGKPRSFWDKLFLEESKRVNGVIGADYIAWAAVRVGGWYPWGKHEHAKKKS